jgi:hypothetical protein
LVKASIVFSVLLSSVAVMPVGAFAKSLIHLFDSRWNDAEIRFSGQAVVNLPPSALMSRRRQQVPFKLSLLAISAIMFG